MYGYEKTINGKDRAVTFFLLTGIAAICISQIPFAYGDEINYAGSVLATPWSGEAAAIGPDNKMCEIGRAHV